jgi:methylthioribose-1-phosphate isomerase
LKRGDDDVVSIIDQRALPHRFVVEDLRNVKDVARAIKEMHVRGAGLIGATAGYGMYLACLKAPSTGFESYVKKAGEMLCATRPTAVNLRWAVTRQLEAIENAANNDERVRIAKRTAEDIANEDAEFCRRIGEHGGKLIEEISLRKKGAVVNVLTHCNAGWLAFVDWGSALSPVYAAWGKGIRVHVWVEETRPRNQGSTLTAWELLGAGVPHTVIVDNVGGHLMQRGKVDMAIVGADRVTRTGDVANQIGTYLKALAAKDNNVPFYVALPSSTFDWSLKDGFKIPIEERDAYEVRNVKGLCEGKIKTVLVPPKKSPAADYRFDVTPAKFVSGLITERGICEASEAGIRGLFPER